MGPLGPRSSTARNATTQIIVPCSEPPVYIKVASIELRHSGIKVTHRLAVVDNFKGIHDAIGKEPSRVVKELENQDIRSPNAFSVFVNCIKHLETFETKWTKLEQNEDIRLKEKKRFGIDERVMYFAVEDLAIFNRLKVQYPGRIIFCNREVIQDTVGEKAIDGTTGLHEVRSVHSTIPQTYHCRSKSKPGPGDARLWKVMISDLPCNCVKCIETFQKDITITKRAKGALVETPIIYDCKFSPWRKTRTAKMRGFVCLEPDKVSMSREEYEQHIFDQSQAAEGEYAVATVVSREEYARYVANRSSTVESEEVVAVASTPSNVPPVREEGGETTAAVPSDMAMEPRHHIDTSLIRPLVMLRPESRAMIVRLLESESDSRYNLRCADQSGYDVQHTSLQRLGPREWLNDEVMNGYTMQILRGMLDDRSYIYTSYFMGALLQTGEHGTDDPNYDHS
jgi:hypothetical protein